jgi:ribonuclease Z
MVSALTAFDRCVSDLDKVSISHLHVDHIGDLDALFIGGWVSNRVGPLQVWGPSGLRPETGTKYAIDRMREVYTWDLTGRRGRMPSGGGRIEITEFDYAKSHVIYDRNGVKIKAWPATLPMPPGAPDPSEETDASNWLADGRVNLID